MMERPPQIPDDLPACQELLRGVLEQLHEMEAQLGDLKRQLDETCTTNGELQRSYDCLKEQYEAMKRLWLGPRRERLTEAPGSSISSISLERSHQRQNSSFPRRPRKLPNKNERRATAGAKYLSIFPARKFPTMFLPKLRSATAVAIRSASAKTSPSRLTMCLEN